MITLPSIIETLHVYIFGYNNSAKSPLLLIISGPSSLALSCCLRAANIGKLRDTGDFVLHKHTVISARSRYRAELWPCISSSWDSATHLQTKSCPVSPSPVGDTVPCPVMRGPLHNARCHVSRVTQWLNASWHVPCQAAMQHPLDRGSSLLQLSFSTLATLLTMGTLCN